MSSEIIKIARSGKIVGQYNLLKLGLALRELSVLPTDYYWKEGMIEWGRVVDIHSKAEAEVLREEAQKINTKLDVTPQGSFFDNCSPLSRLHAVLSIITFFYALMVFISANSEGLELSQKIMAVSRSSSNYQFLTLEVFSWISDLFGNVYIAAAIWIGSLMIYFIFKGRTSASDGKVVGVGNFIFIVSIGFILVAAFSAMSRPGINAAVVRASMHHQP